MRNNPALSVIVPVYNVEPYLEEALRSVLNQNFEDMEIICVNDGSTDGSPAILEAFRKEDPRIRVIHQENHGLSAARNRGLKEAAGEYIYFFDSDDVLGENAFETLIPRMREDELELLFFDVEPFFEEGISEKVREKYKKYYHRERTYYGILRGSALMAEQMAAGEFLVGVWAQIARKDFVERCGLSFEEGILYEDNLYTFRALLEAERAGHMNRPFFRRRLRAGSITQTSKGFLNSYSYYVTYVKMQELYASAAADAGADLEKREDLRRPAVMKFIADELRAARTIFVNLSPSEKAKAEELPGPERELFRVCVEDYSEVNEKKNQADKARKKTEAEKNRLKKDVESGRKEAVSLKKELEKIKGSRAYRFGKTVASPVRFLRDASGKHDSNSGKSAGQEAESDSGYAAPGEPSVRPDTGNKLNSECGEEGRAAVIWFFGSPSHGNLGDHMIAEASLQFLRDRYPGAVIREIPRDDVKRKIGELKNEVKPQDLLFYIGGGNLGNLWPVNEEVRQEIIRTFPENRVTVLPQSIQYTEDDDGRTARSRAGSVYRGTRILIACRGRDSLDTAREGFGCPSVLVPDMVMYSTIPPYWKTDGARRGTILCLRDDKESALDQEDREQIEKQVRILAGNESGDGITKIDMVRPYAISPANRRAELAEMYRTISGAKVVVTDRLHCMIFCAQTGTPCVVFSNNHHKVRECYQWLEDVPFIRMINDSGKLSEAVQYVTAVREREYPLRKLRGEFSELIRMLPDRNG